MGKGHYPSPHGRGSLSAVASVPLPWGEGRVRGNALCMDYRSLASDMRQTRSKIQLEDPPIGISQEATPI